ncbi:MAG TPA: type I DNA topoisomerase [Bryobacteraceae bacterium]|nr:type I DNA topoisomerase [Bryobacteraceae bacterium]HPQ14168.1 type I DNA topoisomerase [Bryobacteraceae bacterium]HPU73168.1 type I DNA topoisomerase [Bryobacteraceae bacterium]
MANSLVIVESPAKAKTIGRYLGKGFVVKASLGHVKDLPKKDLAVDIDNGFQPTYTIIEGKKKLLQELKRAAKNSEAIYLAADPDREGEAICYHLKEELEGRKNGGPPVYRVMFNEITAKAIRQAFERPGDVDMNLVEAQQARRVLDRLVGYKISPLLWDKVRRGLSAGRVQTVAVRLIVEREREIRQFVKQEYWTIDVNLAAKKPPLLGARLVKRNDETVEIPNQAAADALIEQFSDATFIVKSVVVREKRRNPVPPFITSTLQQEAARKLRFSVKRTMALAQRLYEGIPLGKEGPTGLITYMRTDSTRVSNDAVQEAREFIAKTFGAEYLPETPNTYRSKKDAQDAHEAIRPTSVAYTPESIEKYLAEDELKLYRLIWRRFIASQMMPAVFDSTTVEVSAKGKDGAEYLFRATGSVPKFDGFLKVYEEGKDQKDEEDEELKHKLPAVQEGETLKLRSIDPEQHFTEPPPRYNEATLVKKLEADGVGRPSTYASIISTIQERGYVKKEGGRFVPTELGMVVNDLLVASFNNIFDISYTARMEGELDEIEEGKVDWRQTISEFYEKFKQDLEHAEEHMEDIKRMEKPTGLMCDKCGKPMVIKWGRHGSFIGCSGYPECTNTRELVVDLPDVDSANLTDQSDEEYCENCGRPMVLKRGRFGAFYACSGYPDCKTTKRLGGEEKKPDQLLDEKCPQCSSQLVLKYGRFGEFTACSNYPTCKYVKQKLIGVKCPECGEGELIERRSRRGKTFYGCNRYPDCNFVAWSKPMNEKCPQCGSPYLLEKWLKSGHVAQCPNAECKYKRELADAQAVVSG